MKSADFEFELPWDRIAQKPAKKREEARLMVLDRKLRTIKHDVFYNIGRYLKKDDLMVFNDTKVLPVRLFGRKETGGKVEILLLPPDLKTFIGRNIGGAKKIIFGQGVEGQVVDNQILFNINYMDLLVFLEKYGQIPYPPYIKEKNDDSRYQTVYAKIKGSAAAPTAGFHFTKRLISQIKDMGITLDYVTLHVGLGTFAPIKTENVEDHKIHSEYYKIPDDFEVGNHRIVAVGTTTVRTLETWGKTGKTEGETDIYIYPGYKFEIVGAMVTNFHMPKSSLVLLVSAFAGRDFLLDAYKQAVEAGYRWGSFGDAMLII